MTLEDFLDSMAALPPQWEVMNGGKIRHRKLLDANGDQCCPILAVFRHRYNDPPWGFENSRVAHVAKANGLNKISGAAIYAADHPACVLDREALEDSYGSELAYHIIKTRRAMDAIIAGEGRPGREG